MSLSKEELEIARQKAFQQAQADRERDRRRNRRREILLSAKDTFLDTAFGIGMASLMAVCGLVALAGLLGAVLAIIGACVTLNFWWLLWVPVGILAIIVGVTLIRVVLG